MIHVVADIMFSSVLKKVNACFYFGAVLLVSIPGMLKKHVCTGLSMFTVRLWICTFSSRSLNASHSEHVHVLSRKQTRFVSTSIRSCSAGLSETTRRVNAFILFPLCVLVQMIFYVGAQGTSGEVKGQSRGLTQHRGAARSPGAPAPPAVCSPGNSSLPGCAAPNCGGCAGWASGSAAQRAATS